MSTGSHRYQHLADWLQWLETLHPVAIDLGLERVKQVARNLDLLNPQAKIISVAGTNGKGSFVDTLRKILLHQNIKVGAYTSPHLLQYNERIAINDNFANDDDICNAFAEIDHARGNISLTYFEFGTLAAMLLFKRYALDCWILEVGLGGRLDAVNILDADIAVITSIDLDHEAWLGNSREQIALEKAGICREHRNLILAEDDEPASLTHYIQDQQINCLRIEQEFRLLEENGCFRFYIGETLKRTITPVKVPTLPLPSLASALMTAEYLQVLPEEAGLNTVFASIGLPGRFQKCTYKNKNVFLDVAHNPAAGEYLARNLVRNHIVNALAIVAIMADKNLKLVIAAMLPHVTHWCCCDLPGNLRAAKATELEDILLSLNVEPASISLFATPNDALIASTQYNQSEIVVFGSFYTVEEILKMMGDDKRG